MQSYEITHIIDNEEWEHKLSELADRCKKLNGWSEQDLLQLAVTTMPMYRVWLIHFYCTSCQRMAAKARTVQGFHLEFQLILLAESSQAQKDRHAT